MGRFQSVPRLVAMLVTGAASEMFIPEVHTTFQTAALDAPGTTVSASTGFTCAIASADDADRKQTWGLAGRARCWGNPRHYPRGESPLDVPQVLSPTPSSQRPPRPAPPPP